MMRFVVPAIILSLGIHAGVLAWAGLPDALPEQGAGGDVASTVIVFDTPPAPAASASSEGEADEVQQPADAGAEQNEEKAGTELVETATSVKPVEEPDQAFIAETEPAEQTEVPAAVPVPREKPEVPAGFVKRQETTKPAVKQKRKAKAQATSKVRKDKAKRANRKAVRKAKRTGTRQQRKARRQTGSAGRAGGATRGQKAAYARRVLSHIRRHKRHPAGGKSGKVRLSVRISPSGALRGVSVRGSSGNRVLDRAAVATARRASPYPKPPGGRSFSFTVSLRYTR